MKNSLQINMFPSMTGIRKNSVSSFGKGSGGDNMFSSILARLKGAADSGSEKNPLISATERSNKKALLSLIEERAGWKTGMPGNNRRIVTKGTGMNSIIPSASLPQLKEILGNQGLSIQKIDQMVSSSLNAEGDVDLNRLLTQLSPHLNVKEFSIVEAKINSMHGLIRTGDEGKTGKSNNRLNNPNDLNTNSVVPSVSLPQLKEILENNGFSLQKTEQMVSLSLNAEGGVDLNRLLTQLSLHLNVKELSIVEAQITSMPGLNNAANTAEPGNKAVVGQDLIPQVQEMLFKIGLGAGEVKSLIEKSMNSKGEIDVSKLSGAFNESFFGAGAETDIHKLLANNNIDVKSQIEEGLLYSEIRNRISSMPVSSSEDLLKHVKQNIGTLLREKGVPVEEVKRFLEGFNLEMVKTGKKADPVLISQPPSGETAIKDFISSKDNSWNERILGILKNERIMISDRFKTDSLSEKQELRLDINEALRQGSQKAASGSMMTADGKALETTGGGIDLKKVFQEKQDKTVNLKDAVGNETVILRDNRTTEAAASASRSGEAFNMPEPAPRILDRMFWMIQSGEQKGRIFINPPELGRVDIHLTIKDGHLQANLNTENVLVKEIVEASLNELKQQLNSQGITVDRLEVMVGFGDERFRDNTSYADRQKNGLNPGKGEIGTPEDIRIEMPVKNNIISDSQVDVHV